MLKAERIAAATAIVLLAFAGGPAAAQDATLSKPSGEVVLTVSGSITRTNDGTSAAFDRAMLEGMPARSFVTQTQWTEGEQTFEGVPLPELLTAVGAKNPTVVNAVALDGYSVGIPLSDPAAQQAVIAYRLNGQPLPDPGYGPLWVMFPFDSDPALKKEPVYSYSIWQLEKLVVE